MMLIRIFSALYTADATTLALLTPFPALAIMACLLVLGCSFWASVTVGILTILLGLATAISLEEWQRKGRDEALAEFRRMTGG